MCSWLQPHVKLQSQFNQPKVLMNQYKLANKIPKPLNQLLWHGILGS